jgi:tungstate transport system substrate-binding protein
LTLQGRALRELLEDLHLRLDRAHSRLRRAGPDEKPLLEPLGLAPPPDLLLASSTEPVESGLLERLEQAFFREAGTRVRHISVGSGEALSLAVSGRVDGAIAHAPALEARLEKEGLARKPVPFMMSEFAVVSCMEDPAHLDTVSTGRLEDYFSQIARTGTPFVTRADHSGTHIRELEIWARLGAAPPAAHWYQEDSDATGSLHAVHTAMARAGYTLADRLAVETVTGLRLFVAHDEIAQNVYSFVVPTVSTLGRSAADSFASWLRTSAARQIVSSAGVTPL